MSVASPASAQEPSPPPPAKPSRTWYGWQTLSADGAAFSLGIAAAASFGRDKPAEPAAALAALGLLSWGLASPIIHCVHGNFGNGFGSLVIRAFGGFAALVPAFFFTLVPDSGFLFATAAILLVPTTLDAAVLAYDRPPVAPPKQGAQLMPTVTPTRNGATLGLVGSF